MWAVFWVIPILALVPLELFPNQLLFLVIAGGVVNANLAALLGAWVCVRLEGAGGILINVNLHERGQSHS